MVTECYAMVRGSTIRVTGLGDRGAVGDPIQYAVSKSVARVTINEVVEAARNEIVSNPEEQRRLRFTKSAQTIRHTVDIDFLRVDPGLLSLIAGVRLVYKPDAGFGEVPFGIAPLGGFGTGTGTVVGFDSNPRIPAVGFALEVWSKLDQKTARPRVLGFDEMPFDTGPFGEGVEARAASRLLGFGELPFDETPFDETGLGDTTGRCVEDRRWGYTLFPYLRGGRLSGFTFANGLVSFSLIGAQTRRASRWGVGPHDLEGPFQRLASEVSRNASYRTIILDSNPPAQTDGILEITDVLDNGDAFNAMPDPNEPLTVDGGGAHTEAWIIDGGRA